MIIPIIIGVLVVFLIGGFFFGPTILIRYFGVTPVDRELDE